jgi:hypothetical protein
MKHFIQCLKTHLNIGEVSKASQQPNIRQIDITDYAATGRTRQEEPKHKTELLTDFFRFMQKG